MLYVVNESTYPYFNLALDEYLLKNFTEDCFLLWRNAPAIIVGKNQNTLAEINVDYVKEHQIPVVRRLSGGGAVFHDLGNLNFTFIMQDQDRIEDNFRKYTQPIIDALATVGIRAEFSGRNDITIDGRKFSGNAQCYYQGKVLHHGTLLFTSNVADLSAALKVSAAKLASKGVKSVVSRVTNISEHLKTPLTITEFQDLIARQVLEQYGADVFYELTVQDLAKVNQLVQEKYSTWDWNFGQSPRYSLANGKRLAGGTVEFHLDVNKGVIQQAKIFGDFFGKKDVAEIEQALVGVKHQDDEVRKALAKFEIGSYFANITLDDLVGVMF